MIALTSFPAVAANLTPRRAPEVTAVSINASAPSGKNDSDPSLITKAEASIGRVSYQIALTFTANDNGFVTMFFL